MTIDPFALRNPRLEARIGIGRGDITPAADAPIANWGASPVRRATGISEPLTLTALAVTAMDDVEPVILISADLGWWRTDAAAARVRDEVASRVGVEGERVLIALTHTHAGPAIDPESVAEDDRADVRAYLRTLAETAARAALAAVATARPAVLEWGRGDCALAKVRDEPRPEEGRIVCGFEPGGVADTTLTVGRVIPLDRIGDGDDAKPIAVLVHYACHPTTLGPDNTLISPDYVGATRRLVESQLDAPMLFLQGASGQNAPRRQYSADPRVAEANGRQLGFAVLSVLAGVLPPGSRLTAGATLESGAPLGLWRTEADAAPEQRVAVLAADLLLPRNPALEAWGTGPGLSEDAASERLARAALVASTIGPDGPGTRVTVLRLGDLLLVGTPGEAYSQLQAELSAALAGTPVVVVNLLGGAHRGYLPPAADYGTDLYQVWQTPAGPGSLDVVRDEALRLAAALQSATPAASA